MTEVSEKEMKEQLKQILAKIEQPRLTKRERTRLLKQLAKIDKDLEKLSLSKRTTLKISSQLVTGVEWHGTG